MSPERDWWIGSVPSPVTMSVSITARRGLMIGLRLVWDSLVSIVLRRGGVTFEARSDK